ncbi:MAG: GNAT family N-acetyltransferase [Bacteroidetes bacterium]|nr:GNAT family N-acetyltransferase [Bacteroidota bacterium]
MKGIQDITIQQASLADLDEIRQLFYDTVTMVNAKDYSPQQIAAWSSGYNNISKWEMRLTEQYCVTAHTDSKIAGMASLAPSGYLDLMYVHRAYQGQGIASMLLAALERQAAVWQLHEIWADVSITARPFFLGRGYHISTYNEKEIKGEKFQNAVMRRMLKFS